MQSDAMKEPSNPDLPEPKAKRTGGFASPRPADADYAAQVCSELDSLVTRRVTLRLEPEHGSAPKRPRR